MAVCAPQNRPSSAFISLLSCLFFFFFSETALFFPYLRRGITKSRETRTPGWDLAARRASVLGWGERTPRPDLCPISLPQIWGWLWIWGGGGVVGLQEAVFALPPPPYFSLQWGGAGGEGGAWGHPCKQVPHGGRYRGPRTLPRAPLHLPA